MGKTFTARFLSWLIGTICRLIYRITVKGVENIPASGGVLLVSNHVTYVDAFILSLACPRPIRFLSWAGFFDRPFLGWFLRQMGCIPISNTKTKDAIRTASDYLAAGECVCIFPEGDLTKTGELADFKKGFELIARRAGVPVVPASLGWLWGSIFSYERGKYFWKLPKKLPYPVCVIFGKPHDPKTATAETLRNAVALQIQSAGFSPTVAAKNDSSTGKS